MFSIARGRPLWKTRRTVPLALLVLALVMVPSAQGGVTKPSAGAAQERARFVPVYSSFIGGPGFDASVADVAVGPTGDIYVVGGARAGLKTTDGTIQPSFGGASDGYVMKFDAHGDLVFSTYLGGPEGDHVSAVALGTDGGIYVAGATFGGFPATSGAFQTEPQNDPDPNCWEHCPGDGFVAKLSSDGSSLEYATYLGAERDEGLEGIAVDSAGRAYVVGMTDSETFPTTPDAFQRSFQSAGCETDFCKRDVVLSVLDPAGSTLLASSYFGGFFWDAAGDLVVDPDGNLVLGGLTTSHDLPVTPDATRATPGGRFDGYVTVMAPDLQDVVYSTYIGRRKDEMVNDLAVDADGSIYLTGFSESRHFLSGTSGFQVVKGDEPDAFVLRLNHEDRAIEAGTFLGGSGFDGGYAVEAEQNGVVYVAGSTGSADFPLTRGPVERRSRPSDVFLAQLDADLARLDYSTLLGGSSEDSVYDIESDGDGGLYLGGATQSADFPLAGRPLNKRMRVLDGSLMHLRPGRPRRVAVTDAGFSERRMSVSPGATIRWAFRTSEPGHAVADASGKGRFGSGRRPVGAAYYFRFDKPGRYRVVDPFNGKQAVVVVTEEGS